MLPKLWMTFPVRDPIPSNVVEELVEEILFDSRNLRVGYGRDMVVNAVEWRDCGCGSVGVPPEYPQRESKTPLSRPDRSNRPNLLQTKREHRDHFPAICALLHIVLQEA
jgi:hypothetical protein